MTILEAFARDAEGLPLLKDWLGDGFDIVDGCVAEQRANVCRKCSENVEPLWWERYKLKVADMIRAEMQLKRKIGVSVTNEHELHMCRACGCCIPLKVHVPVKHLAAHTSEQTLSRFTPQCWIRNELKSYA